MPRPRTDRASGIADNYKGCSLPGVPATLEGGGYARKSGGGGGRAAT